MDASFWIGFACGCFAAAPIIILILSCLRVAHEADAQG
jgi:hypothetical protein